MLYIPICYSSKPVFNIPVISPVVFQYFCPTLNSSIPLTAVPIPLFLFQFLYWDVFYFADLAPLFSLVLCTPTVKFLIFILSVSLLLLSKFLLFYFFCVPSFCFQVFLFHAACLNFFFAVFPLCLRLGKPSLRWDSEPVDRSSAFRRSCSSRLPLISFTASLASLSTQLYSSHNSNPKNIFSRLPTIYLSLLDLLCASAGILTFNFPKPKFSREPMQTRLSFTPPSWAPLSYTSNKNSYTRIIKNLDTKV